MHELRGPLLVVRGVDGVGWDEFATIRPARAATRHGLVLEVDRDLAVVQVLEGTGGMRPAPTRVPFDGARCASRSAPSWLGRVCNGRGEPVDGGPPVLGTRPLPVTGCPLNPVHREPPADPVLTGVSVDRRADHAGPRPEAADLLRRRLPHLELATQIAAQATAGGEPFRVVFAAWASPTPTPRSCATRSRSGRPPASSCCCSTPPTTPVIERLLTPRLALTVAEHLAFAARAGTCSSSWPT